MQSNAQIVREKYHFFPKFGHFFPNSDDVIYMS